jgi:hypothetical protein
MYSVNDCLAGDESELNGLGSASWICGERGRKWWGYEEVKWRKDMEGSIDERECMCVRERESEWVRVGRVNIDIILSIGYWLCFWCWVFSSHNQTAFSPFYFNSCRGGRTESQSAVFYNPARCEWIAKSPVIEWKLFMFKETKGMKWTGG